MTATTMPAEAFVMTWPDVVAMAVSFAFIAFVVWLVMRNEASNAK